MSVGGGEGGGEEVQQKGSCGQQKQRRTGAMATSPQQTGCAMDMPQRELNTII